MKKTNRLTKRLTVYLILAVLSVTMCGSLTSLAAAVDNSYKYNFTVKANQAPSHDDADWRYRGTTNLDSAWKVDFQNSTEYPASNKTKTIFYLGVKNTSGGYNKIGSLAHSIKEGSGAKYYSAYSNASKKKVTLYARDNNDGSYKSSYDVSGVWDEETGKSPKNDSESIVDL